MSTTTIRLPDALKARVAIAAKRAGMTSHGFILDAVAEKADLAERRADFDAEVERRYARIIGTGETIPWAKMRGYLEGANHWQAGAASHARQAGASALTRTELAPEVGADFERILDHLASHEVDRLREIIEAIGVLDTNPLIGWPAISDKREQVIGCGTHGHVALYCLCGAPRHRRPCVGNARLGSRDDGWLDRLPGSHRRHAQGTPETRFCPSFLPAPE